MNVTLSLLDLSYDLRGGKATEYLTPLHYLCVVDPNAQWFQKWMVNQLIKQLIMYMYTVLI